jgi:hypothetical protein
MNINYIYIQINKYLMPWPCFQFTMPPQSINGLERGIKNPLKLQKADVLPGAAGPGGKIIYP